MASYRNGILCGLLFFSYTVSGVTMDKFDWKATECAPKNYSMQIVKGDFLYPESGSLYVPDRKTLHHGWGRGVSSHIVGADTKPLPNRLVISFFSYTENQFYRGEFDLPYKKILSMFNNGYYSPKEKTQITYNQIMAGLTPGGNVAVWLVGIDKTTEVFFDQAEKIDGDWRWINDNPDYSREEYIRLEIEDTLSLEAIADLKKNGIPYGRWEGYHQKRYVWQPLFTNIELARGLIHRVKYFNGEQDYLDYPLDDEIAKQSRAVPKELYFVLSRADKYNLVYKLYFNETEAYELFDKLGGKKQPLQLDMRMVKTEQGLQFGVLLRNKDEGIYFKHMRLKTFRAR